MFDYVTSPVVTWPHAHTRAHSRPITLHPRRVQSAPLSIATY